MRIVKGKKHLDPEEGNRIDTAASNRGMNKGELARKVSPTAGESRRHLRDVLTGKEPLSDGYAGRIANALGIGIDGLWRIIGGFDDGDFSKYPSFTNVTSTKPPPIWKADRFFNGSRPTWEDLETGFDIPRVTYDKKAGIKSRLETLLKESTGLQSLSIVGAGGVGKSTLLRRAAYDAAKNGNVVLMLRSEWANKSEGLVQQLRRACDSTSLPVVVVIDDISDYLFDSLMLQRILNELDKLRVILLLAEHPDRWHEVLKRLPVLIRDVNCWAYPLHQLSDGECESLVDRILTYEGNGILSEVFSNLPREGRLALCQDVADRHLVVAMLQMRHGMKFQKIIENEYERIPLPAGKEAYALVCYFETLRLHLPSSLLLRTVEILTSTETEQFFECTSEIFDEGSAEYLTSRNRLIARVVAKHALAKPEAKKVALVRVFTNLDTEDDYEKDLFLRAFTGEGVHRRFVQDLGRNEILIRQFYGDLLKGLATKSIRKFVLSSHGLAERVLQNFDESRQRFLDAIKIDPSYEFAYRQIAWIELGRKNWDAAAENAKKAVELEPNNFKAVYDAARILTLNIVRWFPDARRYWQRAIELDAVSKNLQKEWEAYQIFDEQRGFLRDLKESDLIPERVWKQMRPGLFFDKLRYGSNDPRILRKVKNDLTLMQQDQQGSTAALQEKLSGIDVQSDPILNALRVANVARLELVAWRRQDSSLSVEELEKLFEDGLHLNPDDPFAHCWFGTFLKEAKADFAKAEDEYRYAIRLGNRSTDARFQNHPLFLNNLALLIIDEVQHKRRKPDALKEAKRLLEQAAMRVPDTKPDFFWPEHNLDWCKTLMELYGFKNEITPVG
jgi:tetratricopeptide (TPR) repeat protein